MTNLTKEQVALIGNVFGTCLGCKHIKERLGCSKGVDNCIKNKLYEPYNSFVDILNKSLSNNYAYIRKAPVFENIDFNEREYTFEYVPTKEEREENRTEEKNEN